MSLTSDSAVARSLETPNRILRSVRLCFRASGVQALCQFKVFLPEQANSSISLSVCQDVHASFVVCDRTRSSGSFKNIFSYQRFSYGKSGLLSTLGFFICHQSSLIWATLSRHFSQFFPAYKNEETVSISRVPCSTAFRTNSVAKGASMVDESCIPHREVHSRHPIG